MSEEKPRGPATTLSKAKQKKRRSARYTPRMTRGEAVAVVERTWGARRPKRPAKWQPKMNYVAGPFGPAITLAEILQRGRYANCRCHGGGLDYSVIRNMRVYRKHGR